MTEKQLLLGLIFACLFIGLAMVVPASLMSNRLWKTIEARHPDTWRKLGEPRRGVMMPSRSRRLRSFIRKRDYLSLDDSEVTLLAQRVARLGYAVQIVFWVAVALSLWTAMA